MILVSNKQKGQVRQLRTEGSSNMAIDANSVDPDETANIELSHLDLYCLPWVFNSPPPRTPK